MASFSNFFDKISWSMMSNGAALLEACQLEGELDRVKDLVEKSNVDVDILDERHRSPLHRAAWFGQTPTLAYLLLVGAFKDGQDCNGRTPLALAARFGHAECVRLLVQYGADAGARDEWGKVPGEAFAPSVDAATRRRVRDLLAGVQEKNKQAEDGATGLQKLYRGHAARKAARAREESEARRERFQTAQEEELLRLESAITIQCAVRCYLARNAIVAQWATANAPAPVVKDSHQALPAGVLYGDDKRAAVPRDLRPLHGGPERGGRPPGQPAGRRRLPTRRRRREDPHRVPHPGALRGGPAVPGVARLPAVQRLRRPLPRPPPGRLCVAGFAAQAAVWSHGPCVCY